MLKHILFFTLVLTAGFSRAQDTFSIVAVDSTTGEVGSAGASCVDLFTTTLSNDDFLGVLVPGVGAINTQAYYLPGNQNNATTRMNLGETPDQIIQWLTQNDIQGQPQFRQYGVTTYNAGSPQAAAHTGASTDDYKNHIVGPNYAIQGNILLGQEVLDSMEARFLAAEGDLACKLMAAMQGANMAGADTRCMANGTSSLFAFVKVAQPTDTFGSPSFLLSVRTHGGDGIEPIDSLQILFDGVNACTPVGLDELETQELHLYPNPATDEIQVTATYQYLVDGKFEIFAVNGQSISSGTLSNEGVISVAHLIPGSYFIEVNYEGAVYRNSFIKN